MCVCGLGCQHDNFNCLSKSSLWTWTGESIVRYSGMWARTSMKSWLEITQVWTSNWLWSSNYTQRTKVVRFSRMVIYIIYCGTPVVEPPYFPEIHTHYTESQIPAASAAKWQINICSTTHLAEKEVKPFMRRFPLAETAWNMALRNLAANRLVPRRLYHVTMASKCWNRAFHKFTFVALDTQFGRQNSESGLIMML